MRTRWSPRPDGAFLRTRPLSLASPRGPRFWGKQRGPCPRVLCWFRGVFQTPPSPQGPGGPHLIPWTSPAVSEKRGSRFLPILQGKPWFSGEQSMWARGQPLPDKGLPSTHGRRSRIPRDSKLLPPPVLSHLCSAETLTQHTFPGRSEKARAAAGCLEVAVCWVSCADMFAFGYLDKILCLPPHARPSVGTAFPASWLLLLPAWGSLRSSSSQQTSWRITPPVRGLPGRAPSHSHLLPIAGCVHTRVCSQCPVALIPVPDAEERTWEHLWWALGPGHFS